MSTVTEPSRAHPTPLRRAGHVRSPGLPTHRRPRILLTTDWYAPAVNGVVASVLTLRRELESLGCEVRVLTLSDRMRSGYSRDGVYRLGSVPSFLYDRARIGVLRNERIATQIIDWQPDIIHSHCEFTTFVWAKRLSRLLDVPLVHTYHTIYEDYTHYYSPSRTVGRHMVAAFSRRVLESVDSVVAPTDKVAALLRGYRVTTPISVIPTGLDLERFRPARTQEEHDDALSLRRRLGLTEDHTVLLSLGRLAKEKSVDELIRMVARADDPRCVLVIVGDGPYRDTLVHLADRLGVRGQVRFVGAVSPADTPRWYRMGDVFVSASRSETQGLTYTEAMACGLPLLCRRDPAIDGVVVDGVTGWQYDDESGFINHLRTMVDPQARGAMVHTCVSHAADACGSRSFGQRVLDSYSAAALEQSRWGFIPALTA